METSGRQERMWPASLLGPVSIYRNITFKKLAAGVMWPASSDLTPIIQRTYASAAMVNMHLLCRTISEYQLKKQHVNKFKLLLLIVWMGFQGIVHLIQITEAKSVLLSAGTGKKINPVFAGGIKPFQKFLTLVYLELWRSYLKPLGSSLMNTQQCHIAASTWFALLLSSVLVSQTLAHLLSPSSLHMHVCVHVSEPQRSCQTATVEHSPSCWN